MGAPDRLYRAMLRLLPREFRSDYGPDMERTFRAERRTARGLQAVRLWLGALADLARAAPAEHWDVLSRDARFALRAMRSRPALTLTAVLTLGLGIGANVAMFAVVDAVLLAPLPYRDPDRAVFVEEQAEGREAGRMGYLTFVDLRARAGAFAALAAASQSRAILSGGGRDAERLGVMRVSASYFEVAGVAPVLGRAFLDAEDRPGAARQVTVLSDRLWRRRFGADPSVIGRPVRLGSDDFVVVGVMPAAFEDLAAAHLYEGAELWTPLGYDPAASFACRTCRHLGVFGRLKPGIGMALAEGEVTAILRGLARDHPREYDAPRGRVRTLGDVFLGPVRPALVVLWCGVGLLLLAACVNVANLLLLRASERGHEMAVRAALGVTRGRLVRQLLTESLLLAAVGGLAGLLPAWAAVRVLAATGPAQLPRLADASLDVRAAAAAVGLTLLSSAAFGLVPLWKLRRQDVAGRMHGGGRRTDEAATWRVRAALVAGNVAAALVLVVGAGLLLRTVGALLAVPPGFEPSGVLTLRVDLSGARYAADDPAQAIARTTRFYEEVLARVRALPEVAAASAVTTLPLGGGLDGFGLHVAGRPLENPEEAPDADRFTVQPGFFETLHIPLVRGRVLDARDGQGAPAAAVVNRRLADELFPGADPIGQAVMLGPPSAAPRTIVGVVEDVRHHGLDAPPGYQVYVPHAQWAWAEPVMTLVVRGRREAVSLAAPVREAVRALDAGQPVSQVRPYADVVGESTATRRFAAGLLAAFAMAAVLLAAVGLYGALGTLVRQRQREIGVRLALGAAPRDVGAMVLRQGLWPVAAGLILGSASALAAVSLLRSLLYGVDVRDPATFTAGAASLAGAALAASLVPAWRAARTDPAMVLRAE